jgi:hypothetical protein
MEWEVERERRMSWKSRRRAGFKFKARTQLLLLTAGTQVDKPFANEVRRHLTAGVHSRIKYGHENEMIMAYLRCRADALQGSTLQII